MFYLKWLKRNVSQTFYVYYTMNAQTINKNIWQLSSEVEQKSEQLCVGGSIPSVATTNPNTHS